MAYVIDGPTLIGDTGTSNTLQGSLFLPSLSNVAASAVIGDMMYCDNVGGNGHQHVLPIGTAGQVLTVVGGVPTWATDTGSIDDGFSATLTANQVVLAAAATTPVNIQGFTASAPGFDTSGGWFGAGQAAGTWTPGVAGKYAIDITVAFTDTDGTLASNAGTRTITLLAGGVTYVTKAFQPSGAATSAQQVNFTARVVLTAVQTVAVQIVSSTTAGGMTVLPAGTIFAIVRYV